MTGASWFSWFKGRRETAAAPESASQSLPAPLDSRSAPAAFGQQITDSTVGGPAIMVGEAGGNVHVTVGTPRYRVDALPPAPAPLTAQGARAQPARLLHARHQLVPFTGRVAELRVLTAWRDGDAAISVLLLHGAGGQGKTRLAMHFAEQSRSDGWQVRQARHISDPPSVAVVREAGEHAHLAGELIIADYAERWPVDELLGFVRDAANTGGRARILLVARPAGVWWQTLANRLDRMDVATTSLALPPLMEDQHTSPILLYTEARDHFAHALDVSGTHRLPVPTAILSDDPGTRHVLAVHMAALVAVDRHRRGETGEGVMDAPGTVSGYLLSRERDHWRTLHANKRITTSDSVMAKVVFTAALTGTVTQQEGLAALAAIQACAAAQSDQALYDHSLLFPSHDAGTVLEPLYPDLLAEDFIALCTPGHPLDHPSDPWAEGALHRLLVPGAGQDGVYPWTKPALTTLIAAAARWPHLVSGHLVPVLTEYPELMLHTGGSALTALTEVPGLPATVLEQVVALLPDHRHVELDAGIAAITSKLISSRLHAISDLAERASLHSSLATRQAYAGMYQQAVSTAEVAVEIGRRLVGEDPNLHEPVLAASLSNLGNRLAQVGRYAEALECAKEAVWIRRKLVDQAPETHRPDFAQALSNLGVRLAEVGRHIEALATEEVAIGVRQRLATEDPVRFEADYATSASNFANHLAQVGRREEALRWEEEALEIRRRLVAENPAAHEPDLARSLSNFGVRLAQVGRREEALRWEEEALEIRRRLVAENPAAHEPDLARSLSNFGVRLAQVGRREEALRWEEEALEIRRRLVAENPAAHEPDLARSLSNFGVRLAQVGRREEALRWEEEALEIRRRLVAENPAAHEPDLARSLSNLRTWLEQTGRHEEARAVVSVIRELPEQRPPSAATVPGQ
ncbi:tetratricopeptide repeat protein [Streptomyces sp. TRM43335]|uniref:Tetratricopeptide repeat protein n=1 Tax=Streptomyces taklimakanensis TaxID=2569853 RepID=A0A6G2BHW9_9ACTN|nr:tetratricopeptide repeat protein [Streptomyces taklimakanensis]MTE21881.1 tetratricopeptide repeat protein [Streptomyces taklimakanensis]